MRLLAFVRFATCLAFLATAVLSVSAQQSQSIPLELPAGGTFIEASGKIVGNDDVDYVVNATAGQVLSVNLEGKSSTYFNVMPEGADEAIFIGSIYGTEFVGRLPEDGAYTIRVYQMGAAASEGKTNAFTLRAALDAVILPEQADATVGDSDFNATGNVSCVLKSQPTTTDCPFGVIRHGGGAATLVINLPDNTTRTLEFSAGGEVTTSDAAVATSRAGDITTVIVGDVLETYIIDDVVMYGD